MKKVLAGLLLMMLSSCKDVAVEFDRINFDTATVQACSGELSPRFLYKIQGNQALILVLPQQVLENREQTQTGSLSDTYKLIYRTFDAAVTAAYFCHDYPPFSPRAVSEITAKGGQVTIETKAVTEASGQVRYYHLISISDLVLQNDAGDKLIDSQFNFGTYITTEEN